MNRIQACFSQLNAAKRKALIPFLTAGDPTPEMTVDLMHCLVKNGTDLIELGIPFSDPIADGKVIQLASERALAHKTNLSMVFNMVAEFRTKDQDTPIILMGYLNPIEVMGYEIFTNQATDSGVDGILVIDLPPEESVEFNQLLRKQDIEQILLISPTTSLARMKYILEVASGFVYYVALKGVTGSEHLDTDSVATRLSEIRKLTELPIGVGFGIKDPKTVAKIGSISDAVVIGSALVERLAKWDGRGSNSEILKSITDFITSTRRTLDSLASY